MRGAFYRVNETVRVRCPARRSRPRERLSLSSPLPSPHRGHHSGFSLGRIGARNMPDDQGCAPGRGCSLGARSGTMPGVVGRDGARCQRRRLPGPPLVVAGGAAHATAHAPRHTHHGTRATAQPPASAPPPRCPARAGPVASVFASPCQGSVVVEAPPPSAPSPPPSLQSWGRGVHPHLAAVGCGRGRSSLCRPRSGGQAGPAKAVMEMWLRGRRLPVSGY